MSLLNKIREKTPLKARIMVGPYVAYLSYIFNIYIFKKKIPKVLSVIETVDLITRENLSVIRFGDGEMSLITGCDLAFQKYDRDLAKKLELILQTNDKGLFICIPGIWKKLSGFNKREYWFFLHHLFRYRYLWDRFLSFNKTYGNTFVTRPYLTYKDKTESPHVFKKLFSIWQDKDLVLIEGEKSRLGVGNNLFDKAKSLQRILSPSENAYSKYEKILGEIKKIPKDRLILLSLGPTAKVLAYDLFLLGYRVIDIGHIDMEYEMFLKDEDKIIKVRYKYFNEINERDPEECTDTKYQSQILTKII